jgi:predicted DNA-binding transcriptional regulator YafY
MRRTDRLFSLILVLRDGRLHRAQDLALRLGVSIRTIYRDMDTLMASGVPIEGERGLGYMATAAVTLPPLNLTLTELEALHHGLAIMSGSDDADLQASARSLAAKIDAVLPEDRTAEPGGWGLAVYPLADAARGFRHMPQIRAAIRARLKLAADHRNLDGELRASVLRPLQLEYWGRLWTVTAWDEAAGDFTVLRIDRIEALRALPGLFVDEPGKTLADYLARAGAAD